MEIDQNYLKECFTYDSATGVLTWEKRPLSHFKTKRGMRIFNTRFAGNAVGASNGRGYLQARIGDKLYLAHRIIWALQTGAWPVDEIDHIDGDRVNNRFANLRAVSRAENMLNKKRYACNTSGTTGVLWTKTSGKWRSRIKVAGRDKHLGYFTNKSDAVAAREAASITYGYHPGHGKSYD